MKKSFNPDDLLIEVLHFGAEVELNWCCAQISQCHMIPSEDRDKIATYLYETRQVSRFGVGRLNFLNNSLLRFSSRSKYSSETEDMCS